MTGPIDPLRNSQDAATTPVGVNTLCPSCGAAMPAFETRCATCGHHKEPGTDEENREQLRRRLQNGIGDAYELLSMLGKGGMGVVFRAKEKALDREVALKVLAFDPLMAPEAFARFEREARLAARLDHPHIVPIFAVGKGQGLAYYTMRIVRGGSLEDLLAREKRLEPARVVKYLREIAMALDHAHAHGVVHRDIKPANVMLGDNDHVFVADFGIARAVEGGGTALTSTGVVGSPAYMAPEQWQGQGIDGRSDQYALAILTYELLTGRRPYRDATMHELLRLHLTEDLPDISQDLPNLPASVGLVLRKAAAKDPNDRFATTTDFVTALDKALGGFSVEGLSAVATMRSAAAGTATATAAIPAAVTAAPATGRSWLGAAALLLVGGGAVAAYLTTKGEAVTEPPPPAARETVLVKTAPDTVRLQTQAPPETVFRAPPRGGLPPAAGGTGTAPTSVDSLGYVAFVHPFMAAGRYFIDGVSIEPRRPPVFPVTPGRHAVSFRADIATIPEVHFIRVSPGDTVRSVFLPTFGGGARGDSMRSRLLEQMRMNPMQFQRDTSGRGGRRGLPPRGGRAGQFPPTRRGDTLERHR